MEQREGYKKTAIGWIPDDWEAKPLGSIGEFLKGKGISKKDLIEDGIPCVRYGELYTVHHWVLKKFYSFISSKTASQSTVILKDDILFAGSGETVEEIAKAVSYLGDDEAYAGGDTIILRPDNAHSAFLSACLDIESSKKQKRKLGQGNSVVHIYPTGLKKLLVPFPPLPEQKKIADILTTVDDEISSIDSRIQQTEQLKKGLMEKLLTEGVGHTEFKETEIGRIPVGWDVVQVSKICDTTSGGTPNRSIEDYWNGSIPWVKTGEIQYNLITNTDEAITESGLKNSSAKIVPKGSIIMAMYGQGKTRGKVAILGIEASLNQACLAIICKEKINKSFLYHHLYSNYEKIRSVSQEGSQKNLSATLIKKMRVPLPPLPEQKQIATILSTVDDKLDILNQKKFRYQTLKKGLSQQLLTGQMRVKV